MRFWEIKFIQHLNQNCHLQIIDFFLDKIGRSDTF